MLEYILCFWSIIKGIITVVPLLMLLLAWIALNAWKKEFVGKKKIDLACEIIEKVYNIQDIIKHIRDPFIYPTETNKILEDLQTTNNIKKDKLDYLVPIHRMQTHREDIDNFLKLKSKAQIYWDNDVLNLFEKISKILTKISKSSWYLYQSRIEESDSFNERKKNIWDMHEEGQEDIINSELQSIIDEFKRNLEPLYKDRL